MLVSRPVWLWVLSDLARRHKHNNVPNKAACRAKEFRKFVAYVRALFCLCGSALKSVDNLRDVTEIPS